METFVEMSEDGRTATIHGPEGQIVKVGFFPPPRGRVYGKMRFRCKGAGTMHLRDTYLTGEGKDVILTLVPEGWRQPDDDGGLVKGCKGQ